LPPGPAATAFQSAHKNAQLFEKVININSTSSYFLEGAGVIPTFTKEKKCFVFKYTI
jgi:hypothetical protein